MCQGPVWPWTSEAHSHCWMELRRVSPSLCRPVSFPLHTHKHTHAQIYNFSLQLWVIQNMQVSSALVMHLLCVCVCPRSTCANCQIWSHTRCFFLLFVKMKQSESCVPTKFGVRSQREWTHQQVWAASCFLLLFFMSCVLIRWVSGWLTADTPLHVNVLKLAFGRGEKTSPTADSDWDGVRGGVGVAVVGVSSEKWTGSNIKDKAKSRLRRGLPLGCEKLHFIRGPFPVCLQSYPWSWRWNNEARLQMSKRRPPPPQWHEATHTTHS